MNGIRSTGGSEVMARPTANSGNRSRLMKACKQVEGLFLNQLMATMDSTAFGEGMFGESRATSMFRTRRNQVIADEMGKRGDLGLARMLYKDLSRETANAGGTDTPAGSDETPKEGATLR